MAFLRLPIREGWALFRRRSLVSKLFKIVVVSSKYFNPNWTNVLTCWLWTVFKWMVTQGQPRSPKVNQGQPRSPRSPKVLIIVVSSTLTLTGRTFWQVGRGLYSSGWSPRITQGHPGSPTKYHFVSILKSNDQFIWLHEKIHVLIVRNLFFVFVTWTRNYDLKKHEIWNVMEIFHYENQLDLTRDNLL